MIKPRKPSIRHAAPPGARVVDSGPTPDTPIDPSGKPADAPPTYQELLHEKVELDRENRDLRRLVAEIHELLGTAKANSERAAVIRTVLKAIEAISLAKENQ